MRLFPAPRVGASLVEQCPVCSSGRIEYAFAVANRHVARCLDCTMLFLREPANRARVDPTLASRVRSCVTAFLQRVPRSSGPVLVVIPPGGAATVDGCDVVAADDFVARPPARSYDRAVCVDVLDRIEEADVFLRALHAAVAPGGEVSFTLPSVDSAAAHYSGASWRGFTSGAARFFGVDTLQSLLVSAGFRWPRTYVEGRLHRGSLRVRAAGGILSKARLGGAATTMQRPMKLIDESVSIICRREEPVGRHRLSVIVPVYNERRTFNELIERLIAKQIDDVDIEIIIVESNSSDGSRELVLAYAEQPRVTIVLQEKARGKGNAVRAGLERATGDIILFQDADLEYEIEDYDDLIRPIRENQRNFIIGSRHVHGANAWKIRDFNGAPVLSQVFNVGHLLFLGLLNGIYGQRMADPFSMFKVFRRDCIAGLQFECDRFDFDFEIVIKLLRKGYRPLELPVNYHSRSIQEGKKVTMVRDPLTWLRALVRFRTSDLYGKVQD